MRAGVHAFNSSAYKLGVRYMQLSADYYIGESCRLRPILLVCLLTQQLCFQRTILSAVFMVKSHSTDDYKGQYGKR